MYGKIFESIFDSTLVADGGWMPTYVFMSMIVLADKDGIVDVAPKALYRRLGFREYDNKISYSDFEAALEYLQERDDESRSGLEGGRRLIPLADLPDIPGNRGYLIVNYSYYRDRGSREARAQQSTERTRRWREKNKPNKNNDETQGDALGRMGRHTDTDTDINKTSHTAKVIHSDKKAPPDFRPPEEAVQQMMAETGLSRDAIEKATVRFMDHAYQRTSWDWLGRWRNWMRTERESKSGGGPPGATDPYYDQIRQVTANADN